MKMDIICIDFSKRGKINKLIQLLISASIPYAYVENTYILTVFFVSRVMHFDPVMHYENVG